jgi:hypothetical protein
VWLYAFVILVDWWRSYGGRAFELQRFAKRVVGLCASSSGCERNWSTFEFVSSGYEPMVFVLRVLLVTHLVAIAVFSRCIQRKGTGCYTRG